MKKTFALLRTYNNPVEANIVKHKLLAEGIPAFLGDENIVSLNPLYSIATGGIKLYVPKDVSEQAESILKASENQYKRSLICEACGGDMVEFKLSKKDKKNFFALIISLIFVVIPFYQKKVYRCDRCGYETDFLEE